MTDKTLTGLLDEQVWVNADLRWVDDLGSITIEEFAAEVRSLAAGLVAWGLAPGDHVGIAMKNRREWLLTWFAVARAGGVVVPLNNRFALAEAEYVLRTADVRWLFWHPEDNALDGDSLAALEADGLPLIGRAVVGADPVAENEVRFDQLEVGGELPGREQGEGLGMINFTSGSTAFPKGVMLRNAGMIENGHYLGVAWQISPLDRLLLSNPLFHNGGTVFSLLSSLTHGAGMAMIRQWEPGAVAAMIEAERVTVVPTIDAAMRDLMGIIRSGERSLDSVRLVTTAADRSTFEEVGRVFEAEVSNIYGLTECSPNVGVGHLDDPLERRLSCIGRTQPGFEVAIRDPETGAPLDPGTRGEILVRGETMVMLGYYHDPAATAAAFTADGFLRTGDLGTLDDEGYIDYQGRAKLMIKSGGENVSIEEVERVLRRHDELSDAAVVPIPHERFGEVGFAFLCPHPGAEPDPEEVLAFAGESLARFKVPKRAVLIDELPKTGSGKVDRKTLGERATSAVNLPT
jgi:fatty-acyl-CoA synthase